MGQVRHEIVGVACKASSPKTAVPDGFCPHFISRLKQFYPNTSFVPAGGTESTSLTVNVVRFTDRTLEANIIWSIGASIDEGMVLGTALADKSLDEADIANFFDRLIESTPAPDFIKRQ